MVCAGILGISPSTSVIQSASEWGIKLDYKHFHLKENILLPKKQVLTFVWMMANRESSRSVADRFNITLSSLQRVLKRCSHGLTDLCDTYIKWPDGMCRYPGY